MIRFKVFHRGEPAESFPLEGVYMFGQDEIPVRGEVKVVEGELVGLRQSDSAVGLSTLWEVGNFGKLLVQTTRLPVREKFYNLNVEIARSRLLRISQKREEWGLTDLTLTSEQQDLIDRSMEKFIEALCHLAEPAKAAGFADQSLALSMRGGESLAMSHANLFLEQRRLTQGLRRHCFGCCLEPARIKDNAYLKFIKENFQFVTVPVSWRDIEPTEQERNFSALDECVQWLSRNRIAVRVGPLLNFLPEEVPDWLFIWENDFEQVREMAYEYVSNVVERYGNRVQAWDVASGLHVNNCFKFNFDQIIEMSRSACLAAKRAVSRSLVLIELTEPWGEYYAKNQRTIPPLIYADAIYQSGIHFDGFTVKVRFGRDDRGMRARDLLEISVLLDRFSNFGKPVHLSGIQTPSASAAGAGDQSAAAGGYWHAPWDEKIQAKWLHHFYQIALSKPYVETVTWADLADRPNGVLEYGGLLHADLRPKPAFEKLQQLKKKLTKTEKGKVRS